MSTMTHCPLEADSAVCGALAHAMNETVFGLWASLSTMNETVISLLASLSTMNHTIVSQVASLSTMNETIVNLATEIESFAVLKQAVRTWPQWCWDVVARTLLIVVVIFVIVIFIAIAKEVYDLFPAERSSKVLSYGEQTPTRMRTISKKLAAIESPWQRPSFAQSNNWLHALPDTVVSLHILGSDVLGPHDLACIATTCKHGDCLVAVGVYDRARTSGLYCFAVPKEVSSSRWLARVQADMARMDTAMEIADVTDKSSMEALLDVAHNLACPEVLDLFVPAILARTSIAGCRIQQKSLNLFEDLCSIWNRTEDLPAPICPLPSSLSHQLGPE